jgi:hypothetical protein
MDGIIENVAGADWSKIEQGQRLTAGLLASAIADWLFEAGFRLVAIAGSTLGSYEWDNLLSSLKARPRALHVLLKVSLETSIQRARGDPFRVSTLEPAFVARQFERIDWTSVRQADLEIQTDDRSPPEVVRLIAQRVDLH